jgi:hypothetical protein
MGGYEVISLRAPSQAKSAVVLGLMTVVGLVIAVSQHLTDGGLMTSLINTSSHRSVAKFAADPAYARSAAASSNPLWAIPLTSLTATRERPIFSPSRHPLPTTEPLPIQSNSLPFSNRPPLTLIGIIAGNDDGVAILLDGPTKDAVRLKVGESHLGWMLKSLKGREATLQKEQTTAILELPLPSAN